MGKSVMKKIQNSLKNPKLLYTLSRIFKAMVDLLQYKKPRFYNFLDSVEKKLKILEHYTIAAFMVNYHDFYRFNSGHNVKITVVITHYNKVEIIQCVKLLQQEIIKNFEKHEVDIIVVDDGSTNKKHLDIIDKSENLVIIGLEKFRYGISKCRNIGGLLAKGELILFLDPDLMITENHLINMWSDFQLYGNNTVLSGYINNYFFNGCEDTRLIYGIWQNPDRQTRRFYQLSGGHFGISRELFLKTGGFDEDLIYGGVEDIYFGHTIAKNFTQARIVFSHKYTVNHVPHESSSAHLESHKSESMSCFKDTEFYKAIYLEEER
jgi:cellulose synthase/poly-beta-1,6-N-acetylglucosamine synthase-like glycosyltransferase